jgi:predicted acyl esterase
MAEEKPRVLKTKVEKFEDVELETIYRETRRPAVDVKDRFSFCPPFNPRTYLAEEGIICEQDVAVPMRDGTIIYTDIYRPVNQSNIPVIISWSPFGKRPGDVESEWQVMGVPPNTVSRMAKFESADPAYWCRQGYAIANVDPRGVGHSQGDINIFGSQDGRDGHDFIEWVAKQHWCNGKAALFGNSGVAMVQWRIAAEQPPHLACMAPWEGTGDLYRESICEGGIPGNFCEGILRTLAGQGYVDDTMAMIKKYPFMNAYWEDKIPKWEDIKIPVYTTVCWSHIHLRGSMEGFRRIRSTKKWLRSHREFEWPDTYSDFGLNDLKRFYDRYLKDIRNGWELTPRVRLEVLDAYEYDFQTNRPEKEFPLARTRYQKLFIDAARASLSFNPVAKESKVSYESTKGSTHFDIKFEEDTEITGYMKLRLWVEADGNDDMDIFVSVRKLDEAGQELPITSLGAPYPGAFGKLRVSRRELDPKWSTDFQPVQAHRKDERLKPGEIVPVDIEIWPHSRIWHKGQQLRVLLSGHYDVGNWFISPVYDINNRGNHIIHTGGKYDSYLQIPVIPPKYQAGDYIYR